MAIYHLSSKPIKRSAGRSVVAAAAYRSGGMLYDERTGLVHDYTRRRAEIQTFILAPEGSPDWVRDRAELWNRAEARETKKNGRAAHEVEVALPVELDADEQRGLLERFVSEGVVDRGLVADVAIHRDDKNPHAHILMSTRRVGPEGFGEKDRDLDRLPTLHGWREDWERETNRELERAGVDERVDHRSYRDQELDRVPMVHEGPHVREMEARGVATDRGTENRRAMRENFERAREAEREAERLRDLEAERESRERELQRERERDRDDDRER